MEQKFKKGDFIYILDTGSSITNIRAIKMKVKNVYTYYVNDELTDVKYSSTDSSYNKYSQEGIFSSEQEVKDTIFSAFQLQTRI